jgi:hypothetical protein
MTCCTVMLAISNVARARAGFPAGSEAVATLAFAVDAGMYGA